jgi:hypothetical protein
MDSPTMLKSHRRLCDDVSLLLGIVMSCQGILAPPGPRTKSGGKGCLIRHPFHAEVITFSAKL